MYDKLMNWLNHIYSWFFIGFGGLIVLTIFAYLANRYWRFTQGPKRMPIWLERLYVGALSMTATPRFLIKIGFILPAKFIETIWDSLIVLATKIRSRSALIIVFLFVAIFTILFRKNADFQLMTGLATVITASSFIIIKFMDEVGKDKQREHEKILESLKTRRDVGGDPPQPIDENK